METAPDLGAPLLLTVGDPVIALLPSGPDTVEECQELRLYTGGAELNTAVGASRLGMTTAWLGRIGDDPLGRRVRRTLENEGVITTLVVVDPVAPTGLYLREWLPDGVRRPYYYRSDCAGTRLRPDDWPPQWPTSLPVPDLVHLTGITSALSDGAADALQFMIERAKYLGAAISVDPNYRPALWPDRNRAKKLLSALARQADIVLLSEEDSQLLADSTDPDRVVEAMSAGCEQTVVFKRGEKGAIARAGEERAEVAAYPVSRAIDPVGAGDGFNAGFLVARLNNASLADCLDCGAWCGARAVEVLGEHNGYPTSDQLPPHLRELIGASGAVHVVDAPTD